MLQAAEISIHAPREGSDEKVPCQDAAPDMTISIHAPREGSDLEDAVGVVGLAISIHAPREGSDAAA